MFKNRRYLKPRIQKAENELNHTLDEATILVEALVLQMSGTNPEKYKTFFVKKASIDSLNDVLQTLKSIIKSKLHFIDDFLDYERDQNLKRVAQNIEFGKIIKHCMQLNLISDNSDITLYLSPYIESWDLLTAGVRVLVLNHVIRSINLEIQRSQLADKISKKF